MAAVAFLVAPAPVGDLFAARAHESAATNGVGLHYWFSWFGGAAPPGSYSILTPYLSTLLGSVLLGALATAAIAPLTYLLVQGTAHPLAATWMAAIVAGLNLWSGRIPFALGSAVTIVALLAVRSNQKVLAGGLGALVSLITPVCGAFLIFGLIGVLVLCRPYRAVTALTMTSAGGVLLIIYFQFGSPGQQPFTPNQARSVVVALVVMLVARPARHVVVVIVAALIACPILYIVPNGLGSNFERLAWLCLPVAVVATARVQAAVATLAVTAGVYYSAMATYHDLRIAQSPLSSVSRYAALGRELEHLPHQANYRFEIVPDGTHTASYALLNHVTLARGYETQADIALNDVLMRPDLTSAQFRRWLDRNAVGYVVLGRRILQDGPESDLVSRGLPYLRPVWSDADWRVLQVQDANPIAAAPNLVVDANQSNLQIRVISAGPVRLRLRYSRFLEAVMLHANRRVQLGLRPDGDGGAMFDAPAPGTYLLRA